MSEVELGIAIVAKFEFGSGIVVGFETGDSAFIGGLENTTISITVYGGCLDIAGSDVGNNADN